MRLFSVLGLCAGLMALRSPAYGQGGASREAAVVSNARVEQAQRFRLEPGNASDGATESGTVGYETAPSSPGDADLGQQVLLRRQERAMPFSAFANVSGFYTNNAALTNAAQVEDYFFVGEVGVSYQPRITQELVAEITVRQGVFRYAKYDVLDFESLNVGAGLTYAPQWLGGVALSARYNFNRLTDGDKHDEFFKNQTLTLAALRSFELSKAHYLFAGASAVFGWSDPVAPQRDEYGVFAGYHLNLTRSLSTDLYYRVAYYDYLEGRADWNQTVALSVKWDVTKWFNVSASVSGGFNNSNQDVFDYDVFNGGVALSGTITF